MAAVHSRACIPHASRRPPSPRCGAPPEIPASVRARNFPPGGPLAWLARGGRLLHSTRLECPVVAAPPAQRSAAQRSGSPVHPILRRPVSSNFPPPARPRLAHPARTAFLASFGAFPHLAECSAVLPSTPPLGWLTLIPVISPAPPAGLSLRLRVCSSRPCLHPVDPPRRPSIHIVFDPRLPLPSCRTPPGARGNESLCLPSVAPELHQPFEQTTGLARDAICSSRARLCTLHTHESLGVAHHATFLPAFRSAHTSRLASRNRRPQPSLPCLAYLAYSGLDLPPLGNYGPVIPIGSQAAPHD